MALTSLVCLSALALAAENKGLSVGVGMTSRGPAPVIIETVPQDGSTVYSSQPLIRILFSTDMDVSLTDTTKVGLPAGLTVAQLVWRDARTLEVLYTGWLPNFGAKRVDLLDGYFMTPGKISIALGAGLAFNYADINRPPYIVQGPELTFLNGDAQFSLLAFDPDYDQLIYAWDFGDGSTGTGTTPTHHYGSDGPYMCTVVVTDGRGGSATASMLVAAMAKAPWTIIKATIGLKFTKSGGDKISVAGTVELPAGWSPTEQKVLLYVGSVTRTFTLNAKGSAKLGPDSLVLTRKLKKKQFLGGAVKIRFTLNGPFAELLSAQGFKNMTTAKTGTTLPLTMGLTLGGRVYESMTEMVYKAKEGKTGKAIKRTALR